MRMKGLSFSLNYKEKKRGGKKCRYKKLYFIIYLFFINVLFSPNYYSVLGK